jgi:hypothetical protein
VERNRLPQMRAYLDQLVDVTLLDLTVANKTRTSVRLTFLSGASHWAAYRTVLSHALLSCTCGAVVGGSVTLIASLIR